MWSTTESEKNELRRAVSTIAAPRVLEIGGFRGETTHALAEAAAERGGYVVVIDPMRWASEVVTNGITPHLPSSMPALTHTVTSLLGDASYERDFWSNVAAFRSHVRLYRAPSNAHELTELRTPELEQFDLVFIDGDHSYEGVGGDLWHWGRRVAPGGMIFVHDAVAAFPGVLEALREFGELYGLKVEYPVEGALAVIRVSEPFVLVAGRERRVA